MRKKYFSMVSINAQGGFDESGIPEMAYYNTEGDTPVRAIKLINRYAVLVFFKKDS